MSRRALLVTNPAVGGFIRRHASHVVKNEEVPEFVPIPSDYRCFAQPPCASTEFALENHTSVFFWPLYDEVFVQDSIVLGGHGVGYLPIGVANHLFFARGQFSAMGRTRIRPLFLDPLFFAALSEAVEHRWLGGPSLEEQRGQLLRRIDAGRLWRPMPDTGGRDDDTAEAPQAARLSLPPSAMTELQDELVGQIGKGRVALWMIDDERYWLERTCKALGGHPGADSTPGGFWMLEADASAGARLTHVATYNTLRERLKAGLAEDFDGLRVVVTDILFRRTLEANGLDLIRDVRATDRSAVPRTVVIAFTGYGNPVMTAACHHAGADFVAQKVADALAHGQTTSHMNDDAALVEIFWNILWLNAVCGFTIGRLSHLRDTIKRSGDRREARGIPGLVREVHRDIEAVFPPGSWFHAVKQWRSTVAELVDEAAHCGRAIASHDVRQAKEVDEWRGELLTRLNDFLGRAPAAKWA